MTGADFVAAIQEVVVDHSVHGDQQLLEEPPGRTPAPKLLAMSKWFLGLADPDRAMVIQTMRLAAETTAFGFFAVIDGSRAIESGTDTAELELWSVRGETREQINDRNAEELHELYREVRSVL